MNLIKKLVILLAVLISHSLAQTPVKSAPASLSSPAQSVSAPPTSNAFHISAKPPRPLEHAIDDLRVKYGWVVSYEDPQYVSPQELTESTGAKGVEDTEAKQNMVPAGGTFSVDLPTPKSPADAPPEEESLKLVVEAYNHTENPGRFELRKSTDDRFSVVAVAARNEKGAISAQKPLLDAVITVPTDKRTIDETLDVICHKLAEETHIPVSIGITPRNMIEHVYISIGGTNLPARTLMSQALADTRRPTYWRLLFDPNSKSYLLNIHGMPAKKAPAHDAPSKPPQAAAHP